MSPPRSILFAMSVVLLGTSCGSTGATTVKDSPTQTVISTTTATSRLDLSVEYLEATSLENLVSYSDAVVVATARVPHPSRTTQFGGSPLIVTDQDFVVDSVVATNGSEAVGDTVRLQTTGGVDADGVLRIADRERRCAPGQKYLLFLRRFHPDAASSQEDALVTHVASTAGQSIATIENDGTLTPLLDPKEFPALTLPELNGADVDAVSKLISADAALLRPAEG